MPQGFFTAAPRGKAPRWTGALAAALPLAAMAWSATAHATAYVVDPTGDDLAAGSSAAPWRTLQKAANTVAAGDSVLVHDGTYAGFAMRHSGTATARITFKAQHKWGAKVTTADPANDVDWISVFSASYITIDGFDVSGATRAGIGVRTFYDGTGADTRNDIVQNCHSHDNGFPGGGAHDGIFTGFALNFIVQDCVVEHNAEHGIYVSNSADHPIIRRNQSFNNVVNGMQINADRTVQLPGSDGIIRNWLIERNVIHDNGGAAGINLDGCVNGVARNNLLYNNAKAGIALYGIDGAVASNHNVVVNNTIYQPAASRAAVLLADNANYNTIFNNILYGASGIEINAVTGTQHDYNFLSSITGGAQSAHELKPVGSALFVSVASADYQLSATSKAIDSGIDSFASKAAPANDLEAKPRPVGSGFDRGCYEKQAPAVAVRESAGTGVSLVVVSGDAVTLYFTSEVGAATAGDAADYAVTVNGAEVAPTAASVAGAVVRLSLPAGALAVGDEVTVRWDDLGDGQSGSAGPVKATG